jgi:hypothetical protein
VPALKQRRRRRGRVAPRAIVLEKLVQKAEEEEDIPSGV